MSAAAPTSPEPGPAGSDIDEKNVGLVNKPGAGGGLLGEGGDVRNADGSSLKSSTDILALQDLDPVMNMKMHLVNNVSSGSRVPRKGVTRRSALCDPLPPSTPLPLCVLESVDADMSCDWGRRLLMRLAGLLTI